MTALMQRRDSQRWPAFALGGGVTILMAAIIALQGMKIPEIRAGFSDEYVVRKEQNFAIASGMKAIGFGDLAASWLWLEFVQYYGDTPRRRQEGYSLTYDYLEKITQLDEQFLGAYRYVSPAVAFSAGQPEQAQELLRKGVRAMEPHSQPQAYRLYLDMAVHAFLLLGDPEAGRAAYYAAADWYEQAGLEGSSSPDGWRQLGERLVTSPESRDVRFKVWLQVFNGTADPETRERALIELGELGARFQRQPNGQIQILEPEGL